MKNLLFLCIPLIFIFALVFYCSGFVGLAADYNSIGECLNNALRLREAGDIDGAISSIQRALSIDFLEKELRPGTDDEDIYTKEYLQILIECLKANEITYIAIIRHTSSVVKKTRALFVEIADELKTGEISAGYASSIKEMKQVMSRVMVTHSFCVPPEGYEEVYNLLEEALFRYSKAWGNLYLITFEETDEKVRLEAEALLNFQRGNELFSQAGTLMLAIPKR